jgi:hypothetical protein
MDSRCIGIFLALLVVSGEKRLRLVAGGHAAVAVPAGELNSADTRRKIQELLDQGGDKDLVFGLINCSTVAVSFTTFLNRAGFNS